MPIFIPKRHYRREATILDEKLIIFVGPFYCIGVLEKYSNSALKISQKLELDSTRDLNTR